MSRSFPRSHFEDDQRRDALADHQQAIEEHSGALDPSNPGKTVKVGFKLSFDRIRSWFKRKR